nr:hypothetical protein [Mesorhizobium sp.]
MRIDHIEQVARCVEKIDLVRGDERAKRQRVGFYEGDDLTIGLRVGMEWKVDAPENRILENRILQPEVARRA